MPANRLAGTKGARAGRHAIGMKAAEIAERVAGTVEGDGGVEIRGLAGLRDAGPGDLSFLSNPKYAGAVAETGASAVMVSQDWAGTCPCTVIRVRDVEAAFAAIAACLLPPPARPAPGVHRTAVLATSATVDPSVSVGPYCVIEDGVRVGARSVLGAGCCLGSGTVVGEDCRLYPHVVTREDTRIGNRVVLHCGAVIGSDGFGYLRDGERWRKIPQTGIVVIGDDVEIGANVTIDRARFGQTVIEEGVKIDNLVQVAHNVRIGAHTALAAQVGIAGSSEVGRRAQFGGQAGVTGHVRVGDGAIVGGRAGVTKDVAAGSFVSGYPAMPHAQATKLHALLKRLPHWKKRIEALEQRLKEKGP